MSAQPAMVIKHAISANDPHNEPWPPSGAGLWALVRPLPRVFSLWRQVALTTAVVEVSS
jgi:hypothetical protein